MELQIAASAVSRATRYFLDKHDFQEIFPSQVAPSPGHPFIPSVQVTLFEKVWSLAQTGRTDLLASSHKLNKVFSVLSSFRNDFSGQTNRLLEFKYLEYAMHANYEELMQLSLELFEVIIATASEGSFVSNNRKGELKQVHFPLKVVPFNEFSKAAGSNTLELDLGAEQRAISAMGNSPVVVIDYPAAAKRNVPDLKMDGSGNVKLFSIVCPHVGSVLDGGQIETDPDVLIKQMLSSEFGKAVTSSLGEEPIKNYVEAVSGKNIISSGGLGLERLTQFLLGNQEIGSSSPYPTNKFTTMKSGSST